MAEKEYIDKEFVINTINGLKTKPLPKTIVLEHLQKIIEDISANNIMEVVRCKNCKYVDNGYIGHLNCRFFNSMPVSGMDYCKWGEQKEATSEKEVPVKRGHWIVQENWTSDDYYYTCSICNEDFYMIVGTPSDNNYKYCPNCGAKMRGETI